MVLYKNTLQVTNPAPRSQKQKDVFKKREQNSSGRGNLQTLRQEELRRFKEVGQKAGSTKGEKRRQGDETEEVMIMEGNSTENQRFKI